jgi:hypothetical protein
MRIRSAGRPAQVQTGPGSPEFERGVLGAAVSAKVIDGVERSVVQVMLDDDRPGFDAGLLDCPLLAEVRTPAGDVVARDLFDHDRFRRRLHDERAAGGDDLRGVLLMSEGELPPAYLRLAFLDVPVADTAGCDVVVARWEREAMVSALDGGREDGSLSGREHRGLLTMVEQRHPM